MNDFEYLDYLNEDDLYQSMIETDPEDWLPSSGVREQFDPETLALLNNF